MPKQARDTLVRVNRLAPAEYDAYNFVGGPVCHYGRTPEGKVTAHKVGRDEEWAYVNTAPKGNPVQGCLTHMKEFWPDAFAPAAGKEMKLGEITSDKCAECGEVLLSDMETEQGFKCQSCDFLAVADGYDQYTLRECSNENCGRTFVATDGNNCPDCNRPFTRKLGDVGCSECEEGEMSGVQVRKCPGCEEVQEVTSA